MNPILKRNAVLFGLILAALSIAFTYTLYVTDLTLFVSPNAGLIKIGLYVIVAVVLLIKARREMGLISYKEAFTVFFLAAVIGATISTAFEYLLFNAIDPEAKEIVTNQMKDISSEMAKTMGGTEADINQRIDQIRNNDPYAAGNVIRGLLTTFLFSAMFGLVIALAFKNKPTLRE
jgi:hypothetical protein